MEYDVICPDLGGTRPNMSRKSCAGRVNQDKIHKACKKCEVGKSLISEKTKDKEVKRSQRHCKCGNVLQKRQLTCDECRKKSKQKNARKQVLRRSIKRKKNLLSSLEEERKRIIKRHDELRMKYKGELNDLKKELQALS